jgi:hypothetical protein
MTVLGLGLLAALGAASVACAAPRFSVEKRADGAQHLRCKLSLPDCLVEAERVCQGRPYAVLRAVDDHDRRGGAELSLDVRTSEAIFRCAPAVGWPPGTNPMAMTPAIPPSAAAEPAPKASACVPGASTPCTGPGGCAGGQACLADGSGYNPCDCGGSGSRP